MAEDHAVSCPQCHQPANVPWTDFCGDACEDAWLAAHARELEHAPPPAPGFFARLMADLAASTDSAPQRLPPGRAIPGQPPGPCP